MIRSRRGKLCKLCGERFFPVNSLQKCDKISCALKYARMDREKRERRERKKKLEGLKTLKEHLAEAQVIFNAFIRFRDRNKPCICCGKPFEPSRPGGSVDAGHYLSRGSAPNLRFNEDNCFGQRKNCNRPGGTTRSNFRNGVIARIGIERVEALESNNEPALFTIERVLEIKREYREKLKREKSLALDSA